MSKRKLSKGVLDMKFMKRTKVKTEKELEIEQQQEMYKDEITPHMKHDSSFRANFIVERSFYLIENLMDGRVSYGMKEPVAVASKKEETDKIEPPQEILDNKKLFVVPANKCSSELEIATIFQSFGKIELPIRHSNGISFFVEFKTSLGAESAIKAFKDQKLKDMLKVQFARQKHKL